MDRIVCITFGLLIGFMLGFWSAAEEHPTPPPTPTIQPAQFDLVLCRMENNTCRMQGSATGLNYIAERMRDN